SPTSSPHGRCNPKSTGSEPNGIALPDCYSGLGGAIPPPLAREVALSSGPNRSPTPYARTFFHARARSRTALVTPIQDSPVSGLRFGQPPPRPPPTPRVLFFHGPEPKKLGYPIQTGPPQPRPYALGFYSNVRGPCRCSCIPKALVVDGSNPSGVRKDAVAQWQSAR